MTNYSLKSEIMKNSVFLLLAIVFAITGCKEKSSEYVLLSDYTPYTSYHEKINGRVEKLTEKLYWAITEGDTYKKGNHITTNERDSLGWFYDYDVTYNESGDMKACLFMDDNGNVVSKWEFIKENDDLILCNRTRLDTLRRVEKWEVKSNGDIDASRIRAEVDTLISNFTFTYSMKGDTETYQNYNYRGIPTVKSVRALDEYGQYVTVANYRDGVYTTGHDIKYDEKGYQVGNINYDKDKNITADWDMIPLEFDENENWVMRIFSRDKDVLCIAERTITYFE